MMCEYVRNILYKKIDSHGKDIENLRLSNLDRAMFCISVG